MKVVYKVVHQNLKWYIGIIMAKDKKVTHQTIAAYEIKKQQYYERIDTGFQVLIKPNGSKLWQHRYQINKKRGVLSYGKFPDVSLAEAREKYRENCKLIASGVDPMEHKRELIKQQKKEQEHAEQQRLKNEAYTFKNVAIEWHNTKSPEWSKKHKREVLSSLERFIFPKLGNTPIADITRFDIMEILKGIEQRENAPLTALRKVRQRVEAVFWYAIDVYRIIEDNPATSIKSTSFKKVPVQNLRALDKDQLPELMAAIDDYNGFMTTKLAMKIIVYTFVRMSELRFAKWGEIDWDKKQWTIPRQRMKKDKELVVPLSKQVLDLFRQLQTINGDFPWVFASNHKPQEQPISENALLVLLKNIGKWQETTCHGLRATASTVMNEAQINSDWIERQLAHTPADKVRAAYNRSAYLPQRIMMMQWYADYVDGKRIPFDEFAQAYKKKYKNNLVSLAK